MCRLYSLSDEAIRHVKMRDRRSCTAFVQHAIKSRRMSTSMLSPEVIAKFAKDGYRLLQQMLNRHAAYKSLPCPLRGDALHSKASTVGFVTAYDDCTSQR
jgi:nicotinamide riboside kinase